VKHLTGVTIALALFASTGAIAERDNQVCRVQNHDTRQSNGRSVNHDRFNKLNNDGTLSSHGDGLCGEDVDTSDVVQNWYVVSNWRANDLPQPPQGYHWVHVSNQYMLTAIASGVIVGIILNNQ